MAATVPGDVLCAAVVETSPVLSIVVVALIVGVALVVGVARVVGFVVASVVGAIVGITARKYFPATVSNWQPLLSNAET